MDTLESKLKLLFTSGGKSFGDNETYYMHCLQRYIPKLSRTTFKDHQLCVRVFTMQGYERRHKETKQGFARHCNGKGNVQIHMLNRLFDKYSF